MAQQDAHVSQENHFVRANGLDVHYLEQGSGHPMILLHGGGTTSAMWEDQVPDFARHFRVITPDARGHGKTGNPVDDLSYRLMADDTAALIEVLGLERPFVCGYSDGGQTALEFGIRDPGLAGALVIGAAWYRQSPSYLETMTQAGIRGPGDVDWSHYPSDSRAVAYWKGAHVASDDPDYWRTLLRQCSEMWLTPLGYTPEDFAHISEPALLVVGDRDDTVPVEQMVEMYQMIPEADLAVLPHAGHMDVWDSPRFVDLVTEFLLRQSA